jgi:hypothetical protein
MRAAYCGLARLVESGLWSGALINVAGRRVFPMFSRLFGRFGRVDQVNLDNPVSSGSGGGEVKILKKGHAMRVIFFYPGEEGTYVDNAQVTLYENGIIQIKSNQEETTTHLQNCEILWRFETDAVDDRVSKVRLLKPKGEARAQDDSAEPSLDGKPTQGGSPKSPDRR